MQYTDTNKLMKNCVNPNCHRIILKNEFTFASAVACDCGARYCFNCENEEHEPATCKYVLKWKEKEEGGDKDTLLWLQANTRNCPNPSCNTMIEKNKGCPI